jgi:hypothetical protein
MEAMGKGETETSRRHPHYPQPPPPPPPHQARQGGEGGRRGRGRRKRNGRWQGGRSPAASVPSTPPPDPDNEIPKDEEEIAADERAAAEAAAWARQEARRTYTDPKPAEDLQRQPQTAVDRKLTEVYGGDTIHQNDGRHLHCGVANDKEMCWLYNQVVSHPYPLYSPPLKGLIGRRCI